MLVTWVGRSRTGASKVHMVVVVEAQVKKIDWIIMCVCVCVFLIKGTTLRPSSLQIAASIDCD